MVILDNHTNENGDGRGYDGSQEPNGIWYDSGPGTDGTDGAGNRGTVTDQRFTDDWVKVARQFAGNDTVIGYDLRNEPLSYKGMSTWCDGGLHDIRAMYERVGAAIQRVDPNKLIIAEGPQNWVTKFTGGGPAPWGDLSLAGRCPVRLPIPNKVVYSVHDYPQGGGHFPDT